VLLNDGSGSFDMPETGSFPSPDSYLGDRIQHALVKDITGDGLDDVLLHQSRTDFTDPALQLLISNGDGTFRDETDARHPAGPVNSLSDFQLHDLDNDGHLDLFSNIDFARAEVRINDGEGFFRPLAEDWLLGLDWNWIVLDVDGDGGTDFLADQWYGLTLHKMTAPYGPNLHGTEADDRLVGGAHDNVFSGLAGNDLLDGGLGNDWLIGGAGDDMLIGGKGEDGYGLLLADTSDRDEIIDKLGVDRLRFVGFGLDQVAQVSNSGPGDLLISFASGGSVLVRNHFSSEDHRIEWLQTDDRLYRISDDSSFQTGEIGELISDDVIFLGGFEGTLSPIPPEFVPDSTPPLVMPLTGAH